MRHTAILVTLLAAVMMTACQIPGPVREGPYQTERVQALTEQGIQNNYDHLVLRIMSHYTSKLADLQQEWEEGDAILAARKPPAALAERMSTDNWNQYYAKVGQQRMNLQRARDDKLVDYAKQRAEELSTAAANAKQSKAGLANIIKTWERQGQISQWTSANILDVVSHGVQTIQKVQHIRNLRKEAEKAAEAKEAEGEELPVPEGE